MGKKKGNKRKDSKQASGSELPTQPQPGTSQNLESPTPIQPNLVEAPKMTQPATPINVDSRDNRNESQTTWATMTRGRGRGRGNFKPMQEQQRPGWGPQIQAPSAKPGWSSVAQTQTISPKPGWGPPSQPGVAQSTIQHQPSVAQTPTQPIASSSKASLNEIGQKLSIQPGTLGRKIEIETNHVRLNLGNLTMAYRYDVTVNPDKKPKRLVRLAMELFRKAYFPENYPSYDGHKLLYSAKKLDDVTGKVVLPETEKGKSLEFEITIRLSGTVDLSPLRNLLQKKYWNDNDEAFQCAEVVLRQAYVNSFVNVGRRFYYAPPPDQFQLGSGAQMYLGGYQAVVQGWIPFLNLDVAHKAFTTPTSLPNLVIEMFSTRQKPLTQANLRSFSIERWQYDQLAKYLKGLKVIYQIPNHPGSKKVYKMNGLSQPANQEKFKQDNGQTISVEDYFKTKWRCNLKYPNLPTIWVGQKKKICLPLEYCTLQECQPLNGEKLLGPQTAKMIGHSATSTTERRNKIDKVMQNADCNNNSSVKEFGFSIGNKFESLEARVLPQPQLQYANDSVQPHKGVWYGKQVKEGAQVNKWTVVGLGLQPKHIGSEIKELMRMLVQFGTSTGVKFSSPEPESFIPNRLSELRSYLEKRKSYDLLIVVIKPNNDSYYMVKQVAEQIVGCLTQCIKSDTVKRLNESTVRNLLLKINSKLNGTNHILHNLELLNKKTVMVMGADVTHPGPHAPNIPSVVAVTASHNLDATSYNGHVHLQQPRNQMSEIIQNLDTITVKFLKRFRSKTGKEPQRIYFIRDGVSDGEFKRVQEVEIQAIRKGCSQFQPGFCPKLTFVVVQKRHHTRFFPTSEESSGGDRNFNTPVGTCVDRVIVDPSFLNFFLQSHAAIKGVARPTKYCVLFDENEMSHDDLQILMYYLCHVYTRCNRAVSYPAPTYYAHWLAARAKGYLHNKTIDVQNLNQDLVKIVEGFEDKNPMFFC